MAATNISDLAIVPEVFQEYMEKLIIKNSAFINSGLVVNVPSFDPGKGYVTNAPAFMGFTGADEVLSDSVPLTVNAIGSVNSVTPVNARGKSFGANDLVTVIAGADPLGNLASKYANYWSRTLNTTAVSAMLGAAAGLDADYGAGTIINNQPTVALSADLVIDTQFLMGEQADVLSIFLCHSAVLATLRKNDLTKDIILDSSTNPVTTYQGMRVVVDDTLAPAAGVYPIILAANAAMVYADGTNPAVAIEVDRDILSGDDIVTSRKRYLMHPQGASWKGAANTFPTNAALATAGNWEATDQSQPSAVPFRVLKCLLA